MLNFPHPMSHNTCDTEPPPQRRSTRMGTPTPGAWWIGWKQLVNTTEFQGFRQIFSKFWETYVLCDMCCVQIDFQWIRSFPCSGVPATFGSMKLASKVGKKWMNPWKLIKHIGDWFAVLAYQKIINHVEVIVGNKLQMRTYEEIFQEPATSSVTNPMLVVACFFSKRTTSSWKMLSACFCNLLCLQTV